MYSKKRKIFNNLFQVLHDWYALNTNQQSTLNVYD